MAVREALRRRVSAEPDARPGRAVRGGMAAPGARTAAPRSGAPRCATLGTAQKERPIPRRSEEPALTVAEAPPSCGDAINAEKGVMPSGSRGSA